MYLREVHLKRGKYLLITERNFIAFEGCVPCLNMQNLRVFLGCYHSLQKWFTHNIMWDQ